MVLGPIHRVRVAFLCRRAYGILKIVERVRFLTTTESSRIGEIPQAVDATKHADRRLEEPLSPEPNQIRPRRKKLPGCSRPEEARNVNL
jgi:hypothetical protein